MNDNSPAASYDEDHSEADSTAILPPQPLGLKFYLALALVGLLVLLIIVVNIPGIRASAGISMTRANWTLQSYADSNGTLVTVQPGTKITAVFGSDGNVSGSAGCNQYSAHYTVRDYAISISPPVSTKILCSSASVMHQESDYLNDLPGVTELRISESNLRLFDVSGKPVLVFMKE
jgi:heat shock protein HslJ